MNTEKNLKTIATKVAENAKNVKSIKDYFESDEYGEACIPVGYTKSGRMERINSLKAF